MSAFGQFFADLGSGITGIVGGLGANIQSQADYNQAAAAQIQANAAATQQIILTEAEAEKRRQQNTIIIFIIVFAAPLVGLGLFLAFKK